MAPRLISGLLLALGLGQASADEHIVLKPTVPSASGTPEKMLLFIPGGNVPNDHYVATAQAIQASTDSVRLWVVIPAVFQRLCIISCSAKSVCAPLHGSVEAALDLAKAQGWQRGDDSKDIWLAGHSLGGVCANTLLQAYSTPTSAPYAGMIVMGSYVDEAGDYALPKFPTPLLTLNAELDGGLARPGKTALWWRQFQELEGSLGQEAALSTKPVIILPKLNHSDFCPGFDVPGDLPAEVDQAAATATIGQVVGAFLKHQLVPSTGSLDLIREKVEWTRQLMSPYLKAQDMEMISTETRSSFEGSSAFCAKAQRMVGALPGDADSRMEVVDGFHAAASNLEHCHPNWTAVDGNRLLVRSCSHTDYFADVSNTGSMTAAKQIACKMLSADRLAQEFSLEPPSKERRFQCKEGNKYAFDVAMQLAQPGTLERYQRQGRGICFLEDMPVVGNVGPLWVFGSNIKEESNATCLGVASPSLFTEIDGKIYPGNHYCKFLSPARVLDWMMTDGLKKVKAEESMEIMV